MSHGPWHDHYQPIDNEKDEDSDKSTFKEISKRHVTFYKWGMRRHGMTHKKRMTKTKTRRMGKSKTLVTFVFVKILPSYQSDNKEWHWTESLAMFIHSCSEFVPHYLSQLFHRRLKSTARKSLMDCLRIMSMRWDIFCILEVLSGTLSVSYDDVCCIQQYSVIGILHFSCWYNVYFPLLTRLTWVTKQIDWFEKAKVKVSLLAKTLLKEPPAHSQGGEGVGKQSTSSQHLWWCWISWLICETCTSMSTKWVDTGCVYWWWWHRNYSWHY